MFTTFHYFQFLWAKNAIKRHLLTNGLSTKLDILQTMTMYVVRINTVRTTKNVIFGLSYNQFFDESKGQSILKCLFGVSNFFQKTNKIKWLQNMTLLVVQTV